MEYNAKSGIVIVDYYTVTFYDGDTDICIEIAYLGSGVRLAYHRSYCII